MRGNGCMACFMACHACYARMQTLQRSCCSAVLHPATKPNSYRSLRYHFVVRLTLISSHPWPQQARQAASGRPHDGMGSRCVHRCLNVETQMHAPSVRGPRAGMADTKRWPRGDGFYQPPAATPLSLSPNGHFQPPCSGQPLSTIKAAWTWPQQHGTSSTDTRA